MLAIFDPDGNDNLLLAVETEEAQLSYQLLPRYHAFLAINIVMPVD